MLLKPIKKISGKGIPHFSIIQKIILFCISLGIVAVAIVFIWISTLDLPNFDDFENRVVLKSTQLYDRTGKILLYDIHKDFKRTVVPFANIADPMKKATIAVEDDRFYYHIGVRPKAILRAMFKNITSGIKSQGGSTITQQIVKNTLLTGEKTLTRKIKEVILAIKIERKLSKDEILSIYLNESPYGGNIYGVEQAAQTYFAKPASELTIAQSAFIASIPQRPTYYSPYGEHLDKLLERKNYVLERMKKLGFISAEQYDQAIKEPIILTKGESKNIKAPHFVFYIQDYLVDTYGEDVINKGGLKVITTLDYNLQQKAEELVKAGALANKTTYNAENMGMVGIDPKTAEILFMVGSRDYFDKDIDGQYNIATAKRQPGSAFKPFVYALGFEKGYLPETTLFDVPTEFNPSCQPGGGGSNCYSPKNYSGKFVGTVSIKKALGSSLNIPAVEMLYLVGVDNAVKFATSLGISTLTDNKENFGLSLVLGGAEVKLVEMVNAYGVFATGGIYRKETGILSIQNSDGSFLYENKPTEGVRVMNENTAYKISDVLSDDTNRRLVFLPNSKLHVEGHHVAAKSGTTNNNKDAWVIGYSPSIAIGAWSGNNDARPMTDTGSTISGPVWNDMFKYVLETYPEIYPDTPFPKPAPEENYDSINPIIRGIVPSFHSILYFVDKNNPRGPSPKNPASDPQFSNWEAAVLNYFAPQIPQEPQTTEGAPGPQDTITTTTTTTTTTTEQTNTVAQ
jgi:1A family penicillin-binding protein